MLTTPLAETSSSKDQISAHHVIIRGSLTHPYISFCLASCFMSGVQCVGGLFSFSLSLKANLTGVHASFLFYCSALQASAQSQVLHLTQAHSFKFTFTVSLANDRELMSCDFLMLGCQ